jgi:hypothetical protein
VGEEFIVMHNAGPQESMLLTTAVEEGIGVCSETVCDQWMCALMVRSSRVLHGSRRNRGVY